MASISAPPGERRLDAPINIWPPVKHIQPEGTTKEVLHSGLSEMTIRFYAYT